MHAVTMLSVLFRFGQIAHHAVFFNLKSGRSSVVACSPEAWKPFGFVERGAEQTAGDDLDEDDEFVEDGLDGVQTAEATEAAVA